jgi:DNA polymerase gamma 1
MPCVTPSQPIPIPPGESLDIMKILGKTNGGTLHKDGLPMSVEPEPEFEGSLEGYIQRDCLSHRAKSSFFLKAQASEDLGEVQGLAHQASGKRFGSGMKSRRTIAPRRKAALGNGEGFDWSEHVERLLASHS